MLYLLRQIIIHFIMNIGNVYYDNDKHTTACTVVCSFIVFCIVLSLSSKELSSSIFCHWQLTNWQLARHYFLPKLFQGYVMINLWFFALNFCSLGLCPFGQRYTFWIDRLTVITWRKESSVMFKNPGWPPWEQCRFLVCTFVELNDWAYTVRH